MLSRPSSIFRRYLPGNQAVHILCAIYYVPGNQYDGQEEGEKEEAAPRPRHRVDIPPHLRPAVAPGSAPPLLAASPPRPGVGLQPGKELPDAEEGRGCGLGEPGSPRAARPWSHCWQKYHLNIEICFIERTLNFIRANSSCML